MVREEVPMFFFADEKTDLYISSGTGLCKCGGSAKERLFVSTSSSSWPEWGIHIIIMQ